MKLKKVLFNNTEISCFSLKMQDSLKCFWTSTKMLRLLRATTKLKKLLNARCTIVLTMNKLIDVILIFNLKILGSKVTPMSVYLISFMLLSVINCTSRLRVTGTSCHRIRKRKWNLLRNQLCYKWLRV